MFTNKPLLITLIVIFALIFSVGIVFAQQVTDKTLSVASQSQLPQSSDTYTPCCNWFSYGFEFDILRNTNLNNATFIQLEVHDSDINRYVCSSGYSIGLDYHGTGEAFTGSGDDYLRLAKWDGGTADVYANMDFNVHYFSKSGD